MNRIIAVANQKGGVGKTTTSTNLSACLAALGQRVLCVDLDPQGNATTGLGIDKNTVEYSIYDLLLGKCSVEEAKITTVVDNLYLLASNINLAAAEIELINMKEKEYLLQQELDYVEDDYDFIIIDCPPSLNLLTINALTAANSVLVPIQCEYYALEGLSQLMYTINLIQERLNDDLYIEGVVFTMYDSRTNLSNDVVENVKNTLDTKIYDTIIPRNVKLAEAPSYGLPIHLYDPKSAGAIRYQELAAEIIGREDA